MFALLAALQGGEGHHADLRDSRTFECLYAVGGDTSPRSSGLAETFSIHAMAIPHADLRDSTVELL